MIIGKSNKKCGDISIYVVSLSIVFILFIILLFIILILFINLYSVVYNYKMDLYNLNRNAIMSVNKYKGGYGIYDYNKEQYLEIFLVLLKKTYFLDDNLENGDKFISKIKIIEYEIYKSGSINNITGEKYVKDTIYVATKITYKPIIFKSLFPNNCAFYVSNNISIIQY